MYDSRTRTVKREHYLASKRARMMHQETADEQKWRRAEQERQLEIQLAEDRAEAKIKQKWEEGDYLGWGLAKLGGK